MSGRFSPLTAPLPFRDLPLRTPLFFSDCSAHLNFWPAPLRSGSALMLCSCSHVCVNTSRVRYPYKCCFTWYCYIDSCNTRYAPNRRILHLKFQNFSGGNTPGPPRREVTTPSHTHSQHGLWPCAPVSEPTLPKAFPQIQICHYTPALYAQS